MKITFTNAEDESRAYGFFADVSLHYVRGVEYDLTQIDLSFAGYRFVSVKSDEVIEYLRTIGEVESSYHPQLEEMRGSYTPYYALLPTTPEEVFGQNAINCVRSLQVAYPGAFQVHYIIMYSRASGDLISEAMVITNPIHWSDEQLRVPDGELPELNDFLRVMYNRKALIAPADYIDDVIEHYVHSTNVTSLHLQYVGLCVALETILPGRTEITFRLRRTMAVLLASTRAEGNAIFDLVGMLYDVRSQIVHGDAYDQSEVAHYLPQLRGIVSRLIIELVAHNITNRKELGVRTNELGFGDQGQLSANYRQYVLNSDTYSLIRGGFKPYQKPKAPSNPGKQRAQNRPPITS